MTCRHAKGDPNCSSHPSNVLATERANLERREAELRKNIPNPDDYDVIEVERVGSHLVLKVKYPSCAACAYEGTKVLVFLNVTEVDVLRWRRIDPHFREGVVGQRAAPPPAARFPASPEGWADALAYAKMKVR